MTRTEDLVRSTTRALAGTVQAVRPLPPLPQSRVCDAPGRQHVKRARGWLFPLAAAAGVVVIVLASVIVAHLGSTTGTQGRPATTARAPRPQFYMTAAYAASGPNVIRLQVRRTAGGAVTASTSLPTANVGWGGYLTAAASGRAFFIARYPCSTTVVAVTTFYRITVTGSGRISGVTAAGHVQGKVTDLAVSPDGSRMAYSALPGKCLDPAGFRSPAAGAVSILNLSTGAVRTWQNKTERYAVGGLSWAPDGRTLIIDEYSRAPDGRDLTVLGLNTTSRSGSLQAHSTTLLQSRDCSSSTCVAAALAGPHDSLTALEFQADGQHTRMLVVSIPLAAGRPRTVLYTELSKAVGADGTGLYADPSGQWVLLWPTTSIPGPQHTAGWISGGRLHPLPGVAQVFPQGIAW